MIRHYRTSLERVDVSKHKIPDVLGFLSAEVTPEQRTPFNVALRQVSISVPPQIQRIRIIEKLANTRNTGVTPINTFSTTGMIRYRIGIMPKELLKYL